ncbi:hypothetical protein LC612_30585 [Nostoc sp. CHAB 5834]|nr:hypothetical protein [Nostoc sp. CHAB 5834]
MTNGNQLTLSSAYFQRKYRIDRAFKALTQSYLTNVRAWKEAQVEIQEIRAARASVQKPQSLTSLLKASEKVKGLRRVFADAKLGAARIHQELQVEALAVRRMKMVLSQGYSIEGLNALTAELEALSTFKPGAFLKGQGTSVLPVHISTAKRIFDTLKPASPEGEQLANIARPSAIALCHKLLAMSEVQMDLTEAEKEMLKRALFKEADFR